MRNMHVIINIIEGEKHVQKIRTSGKEAIEEAKKLLDEKYNHHNRRSD